MKEEQVCISCGRLEECYFGYCYGCNHLEEELDYQLENIEDEKS